MASLLAAFFGCLLLLCKKNVIESISHAHEKFWRKGIGLKTEISGFSAFFLNYFVCFLGILLIIAGIILFYQCLTAKT